MKQTIVYFHGYGSNGNSEKVKALREHFEVFAPEIPVKHDEALAYLTSYLDALKTYTEPVFVGTSMGGYWATRMSDLFSVPSVIINPACDPKSALGKYENPALTPAELSKFQKLKPAKGFPRSVLLSKDDAVIDYREAQELFAGKAEIALFESEGHRFSDTTIISKYITDITKYPFIS